MTCSCTPPHSSPQCLEAVGVKYTGVAAAPGSVSAENSRQSSSASTNGAPIIANGSAVPRPSEQFVPSMRQVPG